MNTAPDLSIIVTAHAEGRLIRPTLRSIGLAAAAVDATGRATEIVIVLDSATDATRQQTEIWKRDPRTAATIRVVETASGDAGESRNAGARAAIGRFLAFCDGDDLVSRTYLTGALDLLEASSVPTIVHPETVLSFGARAAVWHVESSANTDYFDLLRDNLWPSSSVSQRSTYLDHPYVALRAEDGFGPEDWLWNIKTASAGIAHLPVPGSMFFYRVKETSGVNHGHRHSILPAFDLDELRLAMPVNHVIAEAERSPRPSRAARAKQIARIGYRVARPGIRLVTNRLSQENRERLYSWARERYQRLTSSRGVPLGPALLALLRDAAELEPAISWTAAGYADLPRWVTRRDAYASTLVAIVDGLREASDALVLVPWVGIGGADLVSLNYARALAATEGYRGRVSMLSTYLPERTIRELIPEGIGFHQVDPGWRELSPHLQRRLLAQALVLLGPQTVVSVNCFDMTNSLQSYGHQLASISRIFLTLFAFDRLDGGYPTNPITDDAEREYLDEIEGILTDNSVTRGLVEEILGMGDDRVFVHQQPALTTMPAMRTGTRAYNNSFFSERNPFRLVWPHRLDGEKRPDALIAISEELQRRELPVQIDVYGQLVLSKKTDLLERLEAAGVQYRGPYSGGLEALPTEDYHALLLTSESEGLPLVLVQSMLLGLPVIAAAVGGVPDIVHHGETGLLADGPDDAIGFADAIQSLYESRDARRELIRGAYAFAAEQHGWAAFQKRVSEGLGSRTSV